MLRTALSQLRYRLGRTLALLLAIAVATAGFTVLTGSVETSRLEVRGAVDAGFRSTYDLLVRPRDSYTTAEREQGLVRPNYQSGIFGGITTEQVAAVRAVRGVEVAAPVANLGYVPLTGVVEIPIGPYLTGETQQLFRIRPTWTTDRGTSRFVGAPRHVYVSRNRTAVLTRPGYTRGDAFYADSPAYAEVVPGRRDPVPVCSNHEVDRTGTLAESREDTPFGYRDPYASSGPSLDCYYTRLRPEGVDTYGASSPDRITAGVEVTFPVLLAAVDPEAEAALSGLDRAVVSGRPLSPTETVLPGSYGTLDLPVVASSRTEVDQQVQATVERVAPPPGGLLSDALTGERGVVARVAALPGTLVDRVRPVDATRTYADALAVAGAARGGFVQAYWQVGPSTYDRRGPALTVRPVTNEEAVYASAEAAFGAPVGSDDTAVRPVTGRPIEPNQKNYVGLRVVGRYDPDRVGGPGALSGLTAETYTSPSLPGADEASRRALGGRSLAPSSNVGGYAAQPPALLTTLAAAAPLLSAARYRDASPAAPVSVVRVRVAGVTGADPVSRERLNQVALAISERTGLAVDIVAGASGVPTTVVLPAGAHGRPELRLREMWARKGVAYEVVDAVDRKSLALFLLVLAVCALVVGNAAAASVRTRRTELGVLSCLGWGTGRLFGVVLAELAVIGALAGGLGALAALPLTAVTGSSTSPGRVLLAVPAAVLLAVLAGLVPALRAGRSVPVDAVRPQVSLPRRARAVRSLAGLSGQALRRTPGRTALGASSLAVGVAAATFLLAVQQVFEGAVVGSLLGDAVAVQVRAPDVAALAAIVLLGAAGVADVLYLSAREQAPELAVLRATGWTDAALTRVVLGQGLGVGVLGGLAGAAVGCAAVAAFTGAAVADLLLPAGLAAGAGVGVAVLAALVPATVVRRLPTAALMREDGA